MLVVIVLIGGMYAWRRFRSHEARQAVQQVAPAPTPVASNQPAAEPAPAPPPAVTSSDSQTAVETDSSEKQSKPEHKTKSSPRESRTSKSKQSESEVSTRVLANNLESPAPAETTAVTSEPEPEPPVTPPALEAVADQGHSGIAPVVTSVPVSMPGIAPKRLVVSQGVSQGMLLKQVKPSYPPLARERHLEGAVILKAVIGRNGAVHDLKAISGPAVLAHSAISAVKQWQYRPYMLNGQPVEVETFITVNFKL
jgi:protein TonB